ncbi:MAG: efflux RND transporter permease subunit, partial [Bacteroidales bacterium]|nr:efflux RND transporter permease subunit [Bacteroidales bacterium]
VSEATVYLKAHDTHSLGRLKDEISTFLMKEYPDCIYSFESSGNIFDMVFSEKEPELLARFRPVSLPELDVESIQGLTSDLARSLPYLHIPPVPLKTDVLYVADPQVMALYGVSYSQLAGVLKNALNENRLFNIVQGDRTLPVVMGVDTREMDDIVRNTFLYRDGAGLPVSAFMKQTYEEDLKSIVSGVEGSYYPLPLDLPDSDVSSVMDDIREVTYRNGNFDVSFTGSYFSSRKMVRELALVLIVAVVLLYLILASQFESLVQPLIILSEIVIDIFVSLAVLWLCGASVNLMSMIGLVVVCGIVINDSILKIDTINRLRRSGTGLYHAILLGGQRRLKAIVMTSLTTILAVCPFLVRGNMGADLQYPMSLVIIAGMIT